MIKAATNVLVYVYHGSTLGHIRRVLSICSELRRKDPSLNLILLQGGKLPRSFKEIDLLEVIQLPSLAPNATNSFQGLKSPNLNIETQTLLNIRRDIIRSLVKNIIFDAVIIEFFPFGRVMLQDEILDLIKITKLSNPKLKVLSLMRDITGFPQEEWQNRKEHTYRILEQYFDILLLHGDQDLDSSVQKEIEQHKCRIEYHYTGYIATPTVCDTEIEDHNEILISAGGGKDAAEWIEVLLASIEESVDILKYQITVATGPYFPDGKRQHIESRFPFVHLKSFIPNFHRRIQSARLSISMAGYNTITDILQTDTPALIIPRDFEPEQVERSQIIDKFPNTKYIMRKDLHDHARVKGLILELLASQRIKRSGINLNGLETSTKVILKTIGK